MTGQKIKILELESEPNWIFEVTVEGKGTSTSHRASMTKKFYKKLKTDSAPEKVVARSFRFLLTKESKESILSEFDISVISTYFPDYLESLKKSLSDPEDNKT